MGNFRFVGLAVGCGSAEIFALTGRGGAGLAATVTLSPASILSGAAADTDGLTGRLRTSGGGTAICCFASNSADGSKEMVILPPSELAWEGTVMVVPQDLHRPRRPTLSSGTENVVPQ